MDNIINAKDAHAILLKSNVYREKTLQRVSNAIVAAAEKGTNYTHCVLDQDDSEAFTNSVTDELRARGFKVSKLGNVIAISW